MHVKDLATHPEPYVSVTQLAGYWSLSRKTIYKYIKNNRLPTLRFGRLYRVATRDAIRLETKMKSPSTPSRARRRA